MRKALLVLFAVLSLTLGLVGTASATHLDDKNEGAEACRHADEAGDLDRQGINRGECINYVTSPPNEHANNFIAAVCGFEDVKDSRGTTNKGQCIQQFRD